MKTKDLYYEALLACHSIKPTQQRVLILKGILDQQVPDFNYTQIVEVLRLEHPELTQGGISTAFRLFKSNGLIIKLHNVEEPTSRKGRPRSKFKIAEDTLLKLKSLTEE